MVAASLSATEDPTNEGEGTANAEEVENSPSTAVVVTRPVVCWADISEVDDSPATSTGAQQLAEVKEEIQLEEPAIGEPASIAFSVGVAGDNAATDEVAEITTLLANSGLEGANNNLEQSELEGQQPLRPSSTETVADQLQSATQLESGQGPTAVEVVKAEVEDSTAEASDPVATRVGPDLEHSGFSEGPGAVGSQEVSEPSVIPPKAEVVDNPSVSTETPGSGVELVAVGAPEASEPASASDKPGVVGTAVVATSNLRLDTSSFVAPPTSPNLVEPGVEPIRTGHSPSAPSSGPRQRTRQRGSRGGQSTRNHEAIRAWYSDLDTFRDWLYNNSGGKSGRGFWLGRYQLDQVHIDQKWQVAHHEAITGYLTVTQCLVLAYNIWPEYERWTYVNGLDRRRGVGHARQAVEANLLPPKRIINLNILGSENPPQEDWDYYNRYVGPHQQPKAKARAAAPTLLVARRLYSLLLQRSHSNPLPQSSLTYHPQGGSRHCDRLSNLYSKPSRVVPTLQHPFALRQFQNKYKGSLLPKSATQQLLHLRVLVVLH